MRLELDAAARQLRRMLDELYELSTVGVQATPSEVVAFGELVNEALANLYVRDDESDQSGSLEQAA